MMAAAAMGVAMADVMLAIIPPIDPVSAASILVKKVPMG